jgi:hypothetical protein
VGDCYRKDGGTSVSEVGALERRTKMWPFKKRKSGLEGLEGEPSIQTLKEIGVLLGEKAPQEDELILLAGRLMDEFSSNPEGILRVLEELDRKAEKEK